MRDFHYPLAENVRTHPAGAGLKTKTRAGHLPRVAQPQADNSDALRASVRVCAPQGYFLYC